MKVYSHTQISTFLECPKKYKHYYINKIRPRKRAFYFILGSAIGKYIGMYYKTKDKDLAKRQVLLEYQGIDRSLLNSDENHRLECDKQIAIGIADAYPDFYHQDFDTYKSFLVEQEFEIPLLNGDKYKGFIDVLLQDHAGGWWVLETKTASQLDNDYFERVKIDSQVAGYCHGAKAILGKWPSGIVYNVIKKPAIRLKAGESFSAFQNRIYLEYTKFGKEKGYFNREELLVSDRIKNSWLKNTSHIANIISNNKTWYMNTGACLNKYSSCIYLPACTVGEYNQIIYSKEK